MLLKMKMPDLATTGGTLKIAEWKVSPGDAVKRGQVIMEVETDKALTDVEAIAAGTLREQLVNAGDDVLAGDIIAVIEVNR